MAPARGWSARIFAVSFGLFALTQAAACGRDPGPIRIGVMLPLTGTSANDYEKSLEMALKRIDAAGGVRKRKVELVYRDLGPIYSNDEKILEVAKELVEDPSIHAVIGTDSDRSSFAIAPLFEASHKLLVSPAATTRDLIRTFRGSKFIWRTVESDAAQARVMVNHAQKHGAQRIAVLATTDVYGQDFFGSIPYEATEIGLKVTASLRAEPGVNACEPEMQKLKKNGVDEGRAEDLASNDPERMARAKATGNDKDYYPDWLALVPSTQAQQICMITQARRVFSDAAKPIQLFFPDGGQYINLWSNLQQLGISSDGIEGTSIEPSIDSNFDEVFTQETGIQIPSNRGRYAAQTFDALMMIAFALQQSNVGDADELAQAFWDIATVDPKAAEETVGWQDTAHALKSFTEGKKLHVEGATGMMEWDPVNGVDLLNTTYAIWAVQDGEQRYINDADHYFQDSSAADNRVSAALQAASSAYRSQLIDHQIIIPPEGPKKGLWALLVAGSGGWSNYRHQSDVLRAYVTLREHNVPMDHIILIINDDLARNLKNPFRDQIFNAPGGPNLYRPADQTIDYKLSELLKQDGATRYLQILSGQKTADTPKVLEPGPDDNVLVFMVGHGGTSGFLLGGDTPQAGEQESAASPTKGWFVNSQNLANAVRALKARNGGSGFRQLWLVVEACHAGVLGRDFTGLQVADTVVLTGANPHEQSWSVGSDPALGIPPADQFAYAFNQRLQGGSTTSLYKGYNDIYIEVAGSHTSAYNTVAIDTRATFFGDFSFP